MNENTENKENTENLVGYGKPPKEYQWKKGQSGNPGGRPKNTMKDFVAKMFRDMTDEQKLQWLKDNKVSGDIIWKMGEGNPKQDTEVSGEITVHKPIYNGISRHNSDKESVQPEEENQSGIGGDISE